MDDFTQLKAGDKVIVVSHFGYKTERIDTVTRLTNTQIVVGDYKYRRDTGDIVGGDCWHREYISLYTEEAAAKIRLADMRAKLFAYNWHKAPDNVVPKIYKLIKA